MLGFNNLVFKVYSSWAVHKSSSSVSQTSTIESQHRDANQSWHLIHLPNLTHAEMTDFTGDEFAKTINNSWAPRLHQSQSSEPIKKRSTRTMGRGQREFTGAAAVTKQNNQMFTVCYSKCPSTFTFSKQSGPAALTLSFILSPLQYLQIARNLWFRFEWISTEVCYGIHKP